ncbi:hypothetical protein [Ruminococcus sp.]
MPSLYARMMNLVFRCMLQDKPWQPHDYAAEKMKTARLVVWTQHGIYGAGKDPDEIFGLIETE